MTRVIGMSLEDRIGVLLRLSVPSSGADHSYIERLFLYIAEITLLL